MCTVQVLSFFFLVCTVQAQENVRYVRYFFLWNVRYCTVFLVGVYGIMYGISVNPPWPPCIYLSIYLSIFLSVFLFSYIQNGTAHVMENMDISNIYLSIYLSIYLLIYLSIYTYIYLSIYFLIFRMGQHMWWITWISVTSIYLYIYLSIYLSVNLSVCLYFYLKNGTAHVENKDNSNICLSIYIFYCLSIFLFSEWDSTCDEEHGQQ